MDRSRVYVETSVPSAYLDLRTTPEMVSRREWTRLWWDEAVGRDDLVTSEAVIDELRGGLPARSAERLRLIQELPLLPMLPAIAEIASFYISQRVMPRIPSDALHLAVASYYRCDFLVTWNCQHLANAHKFGHIRRINTILGLYVPSLVTPLELRGKDDGSGQG